MAGPRSDEYRLKAEEADQRGAAALSALERDAYERIAKAWRELEASAKLTEKRGV